MTRDHQGECAWIVGYVPAAAGDLLVELRQQPGYDARIELVTATGTVTLSWSAAEALAPLLLDAAAESTGDIGPVPSLPAPSGGER
ncbi:hypothetical protein [Blastococcus xanthinilyticus]|nr:hypothetical protein [Blastococcus xanthinilyticus]